MMAQDSCGTHEACAVRGARLESTQQLLATNRGPVHWIEVAAVTKGAERK